MPPRDALTLPLDAEDRVGGPRSPRSRADAALRKCQRPLPARDHRLDQGLRPLVELLGEHAHGSAEEERRVVGDVQLRPLADRRLDQVVQALVRLLAGDRRAAVDPTGGSGRRVPPARAVAARSRVRARRGWPASPASGGDPGRDRVVELGRRSFAVETPSRHGRNPSELPEGSAMMRSFAAGYAVCCAALPCGGSGLRRVEVSPWGGYARIRLTARLGLIVNPVAGIGGRQR